MRRTGSPSLGLGIGKSCILGGGPSGATEAVPKRWKAKILACIDA